MRRSPLQRKTPLRSNSRLQSRTRPKNRGMTRIPDAVRKAVNARDNGECRLCDSPADHLHHIRTRGAGGKHEASNLIALCAPHHLWAHEHPKEARERFRAMLAEAVGQCV